MSLLGLLPLGRQRAGAVLRWWPTASSAAARWQLPQQPPGDVRGVHVDAAQAASLPAVLASQPVELSAVIDPIVLGTQVWELVHSITGLPWWASIPATTLAARTLLLPLTLKARAAAANFALLQQASSAAVAATPPSGGQSQDQQLPQQPAAKQGAQAAPGRGQLTRSYYKHLRQLHGTPSLWWYSVNVFVQVNLFISLSASLRQMASVVWPGMASEGMLWFADLTHPSVELGTWLTPYGVNGLFLPLAILATYMATIERSAAARSRGLRTALEAASLPYFCGALVVPQATLLYWLANGAFSAGLQRALLSPALSCAAGTPPLMLPRPEGAGDVPGWEQAQADHIQLVVNGARGAGFLRFVAADRLAQQRPREALAALRRVTELDAGDREGWRQRGVLAGRVGEWAEAAQSFERATALAEASALGAAAGQQGGGKQGDMAAAQTGATSAEALGKLLLGLGTARLNMATASRGTASGSAESGNAGSSSAGADSSTTTSSTTSTTTSSSSSSSSSSAVSEAGDAAQQHVQAALQALERGATLLPSSWHARYNLAMAQVAGKKQDAALASVVQAWALASSDSGNRSSGSTSGQAGGQQGAAAEQLAPVALKLLQHFSHQQAAGDAERLLTAANTAAAVLAHMGDSVVKQRLQQHLQQAVATSKAQGDVLVSKELQ